MAFLGAVIETVFKMVVVGAVAVVGVFLGKYFRKRHDEKGTDVQ